MSVSTTSAASTESPLFQVFSMVRPVFRLRTRTRLKAWPLPGLTISFSTIAIRIAVDQDLEAGLEFVGGVAGHDALWFNAPPHGAESGRRMIAAEPRKPPHDRRLAGLAAAAGRGRARSRWSCSPCWDLTPADLGPDVTATSLRPLPRQSSHCVCHAASLQRMRRGDSARSAAAPGAGGAGGAVARRRATWRTRWKRPPRVARPGLLQKYQGRALLMTTGACAVHCRYCFRRHYDYGADQDEDQPRWAAALAAMAADTSLDEIILSGGDPLSLGNADWRSCWNGWLPCRSCSASASTRALPSCCRRAWMPGCARHLLPPCASGWSSWCMPIIRRKSMPPPCRRCGQLGDCTTAVLNQSVLLAGVNDDAAALAELSRRLFAGGALPYYLHQLDKVAGAAHFAVDDIAATRLHEALQRYPARLPRSRLVRELPGAVENPHRHRHIRDPLKPLSVAGLT